MRPRTNPTTREQAILAAITANPRASYRQLAAAAGCSTAQVRPTLERLADAGLIAPLECDMAELAGIAAGWDAAARLCGNPLA